MTANVFKYSLVAAVVIATAVAAVWYLVSAPDETPAALGRLSGTTNYPSEYVPQQVVCAEPVAGGQALCATTEEGSSGTEAPAWTIDVPAGSYYVSARLKDPSEMGSDFGDYRAYYTEYVRCGMEAACTDHTKISVDVPSGAAVDDMRPYDWYIR